LEIRSPAKDALASSREDKVWPGEFSLSGFHQLEDVPQQLQILMRREKTACIHRDEAMDRPPLTFFWTEQQIRIWC
jgi:hypothetical protein